MWRKLAGKTDVGSVRPENQDDYRAGELNSDAAWGLVCDGMGGARGGREASVSACDVIEHSFHEPVYINIWSYEGSHTG